MSPLKQARFFADKTLAEPAPLQGPMALDGEQMQPDSVSTEVAAKPSANWWWRLAGVTLIGLLLLSIWQWWQWLAQSWQQHWLYGTAVSLISLALLVLLAALGWRELMLWRRLARNRHWQQSAERIANSVQYGEAAALCQAIAQSLAPSAELDAALQQWRSTVKAEHSDEEQLQLFEQLVLGPLDKQAQQLVYRAATDTSMAVAVSPFALADMLLVLWRSSRLLRELAQLYGGRIGQLRSLVLLKQLLSALLWAGGSELALDMASDVLGSELTAKISARAGQGIIAGLLVARLGNLAQQRLRPLPASQTAKISLSALSKALLLRFKAAVQTKADSPSQH
ncbi:MAG: TIGR01620 family protein [Pseudomonadota bacterium]